MKKSFALASLAIGIVVAAVVSQFSVDIGLFAGFIATIAGLIISDRKKVKLEGIVFIRRTQRGGDLINKVAKRAPRFWRKLSIVGIALGIILMIGGTLLLAVQANSIINGAKEGGAKLLLPGPVSSPVSVPGVFVVPWWIWIIGIAAVIIPHEFMHGIMCRIDNIKIKSVGWLLLVIIPGAFVEPDEKQLKRASKKTKLRVYAAGSFANLIVAAVALIIFLSIVAPAAAPAGVFATVLKGGPAYNASLNGSIIAIDNTQIRTRADLHSLLANKSVGDIIHVTTAETEGFAPASLTGIFPTSVSIVDMSRIHNYDVTLGNRPDGSGAFMGVEIVAPAVTLGMSFATYSILASILLWIFLFSFGIGVVNLLPIKPLDGGLIFEELVGKKKIVKIVSTAVLLLLLFNIIGPIFLTG